MGTSTMPNGDNSIPKAFTTSSRPARAMVSGRSRATTRSSSSTTESCSPTRRRTTRSSRSSWTRLSGCRSSSSRAATARPSGTSTSRTWRLAGNVEGIDGHRGRISRDGPAIGTYVINHDATLAKSIMRALIVEDGAPGRTDDPQAAGVEAVQARGLIPDALPARARRTTPTLARFCANCGGRLTATCPHCGAEVALGRALLHDMRHRACRRDAPTRARRQPARLGAERRRVSVLFADLENFTGPRRVARS